VTRFGDGFFNGLTKCCVSGGIEMLCPNTTSWREGVGGRFVVGRRCGRTSLKIKNDNRNIFFWFSTSNF
jgi:hypothetical protein